MAYNFNNPFDRATADDRDAAVAPVPSHMSPGPSTMSPGPTPPLAPSSGVTSDVPESAAFVRFRSCRWQQQKEEGHDAEFCTHREVKPYAGTTGFDCEAWCPDCQYYKLRRAPKKRDKSEEYTY